MKTKRCDDFYGCFFQLFFSLGIYQLNHFLPDLLALSLGRGALSVLQYSVRLQELPLGIIVVSVVTVSLPMLSKFKATQQIEEINHAFNKSLLLLFFLLLPLGTMIALTSQSIVTVVYASGKFNQEAITLTAKCLIYHGLALLPLGIARLCQSVYYACQDTRSPAFIAGGSLVINILLVLYFAHGLKQGAPGIAMAALATNLLLSLSFYLFLKRHVPVDFFVKHKFVIAKLLLSAFLSGGGVFFLKPYLDGIFIHPHALSQNIWALKGSHFLSLLSIFISYSVAYLFFCYLFKVRSLQILGIRKI